MVAVFYLIKKKWSGGWLINENQRKLFQIMIDNGVFIKADPEVVAINFYAPIFLLLSKYAGRQECNEEALAVLDRQVEEFYRIYTYSVKKRKQ